MMAAKSNSQKFSKSANVRPVKTMRRLPMRRILRRPKRSAMRVRKVPRKTSPTLFFCFLFLLVGNVEGFVWMGELTTTTTTYRVMDMKRPIRRSEKPSSAKNNAVVGRKEEISISAAFSHSFSLFFCL